MKKFVVKRYNYVESEVMEKEMNELAGMGYFPKEIELENSENRVDATIIYERGEIPKEDKEIVTTQYETLEYYRKVLEALKEEINSMKFGFDRGIDKTFIHHYDQAMELIDKIGELDKLNK